MLVLKVGLSVIANDPVGVGCGGSACVPRRNLSAQIIVQPIEQTFSKIHVSNGVDLFGDLNGARHLSVAVGPVVLNALHVPLVHHYDNLVALRTVNRPKQVIVLVVNQDLLQLREEDFSVLNVPVGRAGIHALLSVGTCSNYGQLGPTTLHFGGPARIKVLAPLVEVVDKVEARLVEQTLPGRLVCFGAQKFKFCS